MSYTGYTEGTFSAQISDSRIKIQTLERQVMSLTEALLHKEQEIKILQNKLQTHVEINDTLLNVDKLSTQQKQTKQTKQN